MQKQTMTFFYCLWQNKTREMKSREKAWCVWEHLIKTYQSPCPCCHSLLTASRWGSQWKTALSASYSRFSQSQQEWPTFRHLVLKIPRPRYILWRQISKIKGGQILWLLECVGETDCLGKPKMSHRCVPSSPGSISIQTYDYYNHGY